MTEPTTPRGTPPNVKQLARDLGPRLALWDAIAAMVKEFGATWRWVHSEQQNTWTFRSYLPGERFFCAISPVDGGLEVSLNIKAEEWDAIDGSNAAERVTWVKSARKVDTLEYVPSTAFTSSSTVAGSGCSWAVAEVDNPAKARLTVRRAADRTR